MRQKMLKIRLHDSTTAELKTQNMFHAVNYIKISAAL